ncbi:MAG: bifunctional DNA primase/polymerase [Planctomycetes bacterium]|nr:bifunctional DNA primase/polymerase [Planctomycetota bacterium]
MAQNERAPLAATSEAQQNQQDGSSVARTGDDDNATLEAALAYAARGWHVLPVDAAKRPLVAWGAERTTDAETIRGWWRRWPHAGVAIATKPSGLVVVDIDVPDAWAAVTGPEPDGCALVASTPRGGRHLFYAEPGAGMVCTATARWPGIDIRAAGGEHGGYVVAPPAPGREWQVGDPLDEADLQPMPAWLAEHLVEREHQTAPNCTPSTPRRAGTATAARLAEVASALQCVDPSEDRTHWLATIFAVHAALDGDPAGAELVEQWSATTTHAGQYVQGEANTIYRGTRAPGPGDRRPKVDAGTLFAQARRNGWTAPPVDPADLPPFLRESAETQARQSAKSHPAAADDAPNQDDPALQPFYAAWRPLRSLDEAPPPVDYLLRLPTKHGEPVPPGSLGDGFLRRGVVASLVGQGGVGKTMAMLQLAIAIAIGDRWLGYFPAPLQRGRVLIMLGEEDAEEAHRRLYWATRNLSPADRRAVEQQVVVVGLRGGQFPLLEQPKPGRTCPTIYFNTLEQVLHKRAGEHGWAAVLIDPLSRFAGIDTDLSNANGTAVVQVLERLTTAPGNPSVVAGIHSSKASRQQGQTAVVRGASALTDGVRLEMTLSRDGEQVRLATSKTNYGSMLAGKGIPVEVGEHGVLSVLADYRPGAPTAADANPLLAESLERDIAALVASVAERAGQDGRYRGSAETAGNLVGIGDKRARKALKEALHRGLLVAGGTTRDRWFAAGESRQGALPRIERGEEGDDDSRQRPISGTPPVPPNAGAANWVRGTPSLDSRHLPGIAGNCRESESDTGGQPKRRRAKRRQVEPQQP